MKIIRMIDTFPPAPELDVAYFIDFEKQKCGFSFTVIGRYRSDLSPDIRFDPQKFKFVGHVNQEVGYSSYENEHYTFFKERYIDEEPDDNEIKDELESPDAPLKQILQANFKRILKSVFGDYSHV